MIEQIIKFVTQKEVYGVVFIVALGYIVYKFSGLIFEKIINSGKTELEKKKRKTIVKLFQSITRYLVFILIVLFALELNGVNTRSLIAGLGIVGAILGLALQDTIKDLINGITIILDNFFVVGDLVDYQGFTGEVIELGLKTTKIKAVNGQVKIISNRNITEIINLSQKTSCFTLEITTSYEDSIKDVEKTLNKVAEEACKVKEIHDCKFLGIEKFADSSVNYALRVWCKRGTHWDMQRVVHRMVKEAYDKNNLTIPYAQVEVHDAKKI